MSHLITPAELSEHLAEIKLFDIRWSLTDPNYGLAEYEAGHIPNAIFVDLDRDLSDPPGIQGRHPLPSPQAWAGTLGGLGIGPTDRVVAYDDMGGAVAARMWWMLQSIGHQNARVLDGGYQAWVSAGLETEAGRNIPDPTNYPTPEAFTGVVGYEDLEGRTVIDVRASERYRGATEPVDPKAGHIPGAINLPMTGSLDEADRFLDPEALRDRFCDVDGTPVIHCGSGVNACHTALAMVVAGMPIPDIYVGSFSEWARRDFPVVTGDEP
jgi:thiosulfate/3-mercaptopyruvate sulfurtransferase